MVCHHCDDKFWNAVKMENHKINIYGDFRNSTMHDNDAKEKLRIEAEKLTNKDVEKRQYLSTLLLATNLV